MWKVILYVKTVLTDLSEWRENKQIQTILKDLEYFQIR